MSRLRHTFVLFVCGAAAAFVASGTTAWGQGGYRPGPGRLSGTYELDRNRSDNAQRVADQATRALAPGQRDRVQQNLVNRLDAPDSLAIDLQGRSVTVMSSTGPRVTFDADGRSHTETGPYGRPQTTRAEMRGDSLIVTTTGNRGSDFTVQFDPTPDGLRVMRQLDSDVLQGSVSAQAVYRRVAAEPRWTVYGGPRPGGPSGFRGERVMVAEGTALTARLDRDLNTRTAREGEHFTMTVVAPAQFRGASVDGIVARTAAGGGRANMDFDFDTIRMNDGQQGPFEAVVDSVRLPDGTSVRVNRAGSVREQPTGGANAGDTAIGAALGAVIGAIAGGGKGAAIGAVAGGAGTVLIEGRDELSLPAGSEFAISAVRVR